MTRLLGKFGFVHRTLWEREGAYRVALLFGPMPLLGCLVAVAIWAGIQTVRQDTAQPTPWAAVRHSAFAGGADAPPRVVQPRLPLPAANPDGSLAGHPAGWRVLGHPIQVSATMDVDLAPTPLDDFKGFLLDGPTVDTTRIMAAGPKTPLYVGTGAALLAIREPGVYAISAHFDRPEGPPANCLIRLGFAGGRVVSSLEVALSRAVSRTFDPVRFDLQPGLYPIAFAFGCWHDQEPIGPGTITLLVGHPGDAPLPPARPEDIVR